MFTTLCLKICRISNWSTSIWSDFRMLCNCINTHVPSNYMLNALYWTNSSYSWMCNCNLTRHDLYVYCMNLAPSWLEQEFLNMEAAHCCKQLFSFTYSMHSLLDRQTEEQINNSSLTPKHHIVCRKLHYCIILQLFHITARIKHCSQHLFSFGQNITSKGNHSRGLCAFVWWLSPLFWRRPPWTESGRQVLLLDALRRIL